MKTVDFNYAQVPERNRSHIAIYTISVFHNVSFELLTPTLPPASKNMKIIDFLWGQNNFNFQQIVTYQLTYLMR